MQHHVTHTHTVCVWGGGGRASLLIPVLLRWCVWRKASSLHTAAPFPLTPNASTSCCFTPPPPPRAPPPLLAPLKHSSLLPTTITITASPQVLSRDKDDFDAMLARARLYPLIGEPWRARTQLAALLAREPGHPEVGGWVGWVGGFV